MTKRKMLRIGAAALAAVLLFAGLTMLTKDRLQERIENKKLEQYAPNEAVRKELDNAVNDNSSDLSVPENVKKEIVQNQSQFQSDYDEGIGWLYIPGTSINYPIMYSGDNDYYLHRAADGSYLYAGSLFLDYRCSSDFSDFYSIVYGHNMRDGTKFAELVNYKNDKYFHDHRYGWLTAGQNVYPIEFFAVSEVRCDSEIYTASDTQTWLSKLQGEALLFEETQISDSDNMILLSTCSGDNSAWRTVVAGKILKN